MQARRQSGGLGRFARNAGSDSARVACALFCSRAQTSGDGRQRTTERSVKKRLRPSQGELNEIVAVSQFNRAYQQGGGAQEGATAADYRCSGWKRNASLFLCCQQT